MFYKYNRIKIIIFNILIILDEYIYLIFFLIYETNKYYSLFLLNKYFIVNDSLIILP